MQRPWERRGINRKGIHAYQNGTEFQKLHFWSTQTIYWGPVKNQALYWMLYAAAAAAAMSRQSCLTLCDLIDGSPPGSPIPGILQARILEWVAISFSSAWKWKVKVKSLSRVRLWVTAWTAAPPGSSVHGIFQARVLEWGAIAFSGMLYDCCLSLTTEHKLHEDRSYCLFHSLLWAQI